MQRAKHADRKRETRTKILIGEAAQRAGAFDLTPEEIEAVLSHYAETGGDIELKTYVKDRLPAYEGGSAATRRNDDHVTEPGHDT